MRPDVERRVEGVVVRGHGVASGLSADSPYPEGTISMQLPIFARLGLDLSRFYPATINVDVSPLRVCVRETAIRFENVQWSKQHPPETFSFARCRVVFNEKEFQSVVYHPHPETKRAHFQGDSLLEILAPYIRGLHYGSRVDLIVGDDIGFQ